MSKPEVKTGSVIQAEISDLVFSTKHQKNMTKEQSDELNKLLVERWVRLSEHEGLMAEKDKEIEKLIEQRNIEWGCVEKERKRLDAIRKHYEKRPRPKGLSAFSCSQEKWNEELGVLLEETKK